MLDDTRGGDHDAAVSCAELIDGLCSSGERSYVWDLIRGKGTGWDGRGGEGTG